MTSDQPPPGSPSADERPDFTLETMLAAADVRGAADFARSLHGAELADALERLHDDERARVLLQPDAATAAEALDYVESHFRGNLLAGLPPDQIVETLALEDDDVATDVIQALPDETAAAVLDALPGERRDAIDALLVQHHETAGGRMTEQLVTVLERRSPSRSSLNSAGLRSMSASRSTSTCATTTDASAASSTCARCSPRSRTRSPIS